MKKLEEEPETYDKQFTVLTKGVNQKVQEWILNKLRSSERVLEVGCGTGSFAIEMALKGHSVIAFDKNPMMINTAMKKYPKDANLNLSFQIGTFKDWNIEDNSKDTIVSTFMLSELRRLEQQVFLRNAWKALKPNGRLLIAAEFVPSSIWKIWFKVKRWWYKKKLRRFRTGLKHPLKWFHNYLTPIGFKKISEGKWKHGSIKVLELQKIIKNSDGEPGYYRPPSRSFKGLKARFRIIRCLFTGQVDHIEIEPGIYQSGTPDSESPILVTTNYDYTYIKVMRNIEKVDAWVLCVDSLGINVWCAARGGNFGNDQLIEAVDATGIKKLTDRKTLILPQLSAGGVATPLLYEKKINFPFKIKYGPIWSKQLPTYLEENPARKPDKMKIANFIFSHRMRAGITHAAFLLRKIFLKVSIPLIFLIIFLGGFIKLWIIGELLLAVVVTNIFLAIFFPIANFTRKFIIKGTIFGFLNIIILGIFLLIIHHSFIFVLLNAVFLFWLGFFSTFSFSGYTFSTSPREIAEEYPIFRLINLISLIFGTIMSTIGFIII